MKKTARLGLETYTEGSDPHPTRTKFGSEREILDALVALASQGVTSARPAPGVLNRLYWDTTVKRLYWDDGAAWNEITTNGGGGAGKSITPGVAAVEGTSARSARADHTHLLELATAAVDGAMSKADKSKLDGARPDAVPNALVQRDSGGRYQAAAPSAAGDVANKIYVDNQIETRAATNHTHTWAQVTGAPAFITAADGDRWYAQKAHTHDWSQITGKPVLVSLGYADANYARSATFNQRITAGNSYTYLKSPNGSTAFSVNDNGTVGASAAYNTNAATGGSWRALWVNSSGIFGYNLSSRKYKTNEQPYEPDARLLEDVSPKWYQLKADVLENGSAGAAWHVNFIAEDLHDAGLTEYVSYDGKGTDRENAETINEQLIVNALWAFAKQQRDQIAALANRVAALEGPA